MTSSSSLIRLLEQMASLALRQRPAQTQMLQSVYDAIKEHHILCIEAPTGTGKTLAYCLGALKARSPQQQLIVSTATTALQEQFFQKDLILLEKILNESLVVVLAKGRRRYVCHARLFRPEQFLETTAYETEIKTLQELINDKKWQGEFDKLPIAIAPEVLQSVSTDKSGCSAGRCEYFNDCVFYHNRRKMQQADIVVTNHSLLLSDLELGGGVILPEMKDSIYVLDECHHLPEKALSHFAKQAALLRSFDWINNISKTLVKAIMHIKFQQQNSDDLNRHIKNLVEELRKVKQFLDTHTHDFQDEQWRITQLDNTLSDLASSIIVNTGGMAFILRTVLHALDGVYEICKNSDKVKAEIIAHLQSTLNFVLDRCDNMIAIWHDLLSLNETNDQPPLACWFTKNDSRDGIDYTLHTSPINISAAMKSLFWDKLNNGAVLCSATLRALGKFNDFTRKIGLKDNPRVTEKILQSPFEHQHSVLFVPQMKAEPTPALQEQHLHEILMMLPQLILPKSGTLVLFTSRKAMDYVFKNITHDIKNDILLQDHRSKFELIKQHKEKIDQAQRSIIFGLASFAEGIDLPGAYCQHVIIQKIPFLVPSDPISQTRAEWLKKHQADPFQLVTLPETSIKLAQYIGRLLRHEDDRGIVTILDKRLYTKSYGKLLLDNLPPFTTLINCPLDVFMKTELVSCYDN